MTRSVLGALAALVVFSNSAQADIPYWQGRSGLLPFVRTIAVDPTDPNVVYAGASNAATPNGEINTLAGSGIFRSGDGALSWTPRNSGLPSLLISALVIDPATPTTLYAGIDGNGIFKTTDAGLSWMPVNAGITNFRTYALAIDPTTPTTLYAGAHAAGGPNRLYRSNDGGANWTPTVGLGTVYDIAIDPVTPSTIYAGTSSGVRRSTNGGATFNATGAFPGDEAFPEVRALVIDASNPSMLLAAVYGFNRGVFRTTDGGATWALASTGLRGRYDAPQHMVALAQDPVSPAVFYASSIDDTYRSHDGGLTWALFNAGLSRGQCNDFGTHPDGTVYTGSVFSDFHRLAVRPSGVNHFRCFKAHAKGFVPQPLTVTDAFGTANTIALKPVRYCTPTDPMGEGVVDPTSHLVCYKTAKTAFTEQPIGFLTQRIDGYRGYRLKSPDTICLPATTGIPAAAPRDAYRCFAGPKWSSNPIDFTVADGYGSQLIRKHKMERFCVPTDLDGSGENRIEPGVDLRCDSMKGKAAFTRTTVTTTDRLGTLTLNLIKPDTHCFQALESRD